MCRSICSSKGNFYSYLRQHKFVNEVNSKSIVRSSLSFPSRNTHFSSTSSDGAEGNISALLNDGVSFSSYNNIGMAGSLAAIDTALDKPS